jgi:cytochrome c-type biogenesis protein
MDYFLTFMEGIITFISPCLLPMLPIYITFFAGNTSAEENKKETITRAIGFVLGFTIVFTLLGATAGTFGKIIKEYSLIFNIIGGFILIIFGLNYMQVLKLNFLNSTKKLKSDLKVNGFLSSLLFGIIFSIGWTPCVGAFLGSALMLAANSQSTIKGVTLLFIYSLGLGIPFIISAFLIGSLKQGFEKIKKHYKTINFISGLLLIIIGIMMMFGLLNSFLSIFFKIGV